VSLASNGSQPLDDRDVGLSPAQDQRSAIISALRNWLTSWSPYRECQPGDSANGVVKPY
jgi:hypothetical protein